MTDPALWVLELRYPELDAPVYAGRTSDGSLGWAPTIATAERFATKEIAYRVANNYGPNTVQYAHAVKAEARDD